MLQTQCGLLHVIAGAADGQRANVLHHLSKDLTLDILHYEIVQVALLRTFVAQDDIGMSHPEGTEEL